LMASMMAAMPRGMQQTMAEPRNAPATMRAERRKDSGSPTEARRARVAKEPADTMNRQTRPIVRKKVGDGKAGSVGGSGSGHGGGGSGGGGG